LQKTSTNLSVMGKERMKKSPATLGDVLYARSKVPVPEQDWAALVQSIAAGDQLALHALYERAHRMVFTLIMRITANRETAEELTIDVFHDVWRRAPRYDAANGTVLGWIMNQARAASGHIAAVPPRSVMNSRRLMCQHLQPKQVTTLFIRRLLQHSKNWTPIGRSGSTSTELAEATRPFMSAMPPIASIGASQRTVASCQVRT
jgi:Sigma-70 region 2